jgi:DNA-binding XRE family transcriptional regulator
MKGPHGRLVDPEPAMKKTNFDRYLEEQLQDPVFAGRFADAGEAWDVSLQIARLRQQAGLFQKEVACKLKTSRQQVSRLESPGYEGHSLNMLRRVARVLRARVRMVFDGEEQTASGRIAEEPATYRAKSRIAK